MNARYIIGIWIALAMLIAACDPSSSGGNTGTAIPTAVPLLSGPATFALPDNNLRPNGDCVPGGADITMQTANGTFALAFISSTGVEDDGIEGSLTGGSYTGTVTPVTRSSLVVGDCNTMLPLFSIGASFTSITYRAFYDNNSNPICVYRSRVTITGLAFTGLDALDAVFRPLIEDAIRDDLHRGIDRDAANRLNRLFNNSEPLPQGNTGRCADWELLTN